MKQKPVLFLLAQLVVFLLHAQTDPREENLDTVVITGTLKPVLRTESPVPVEVYTPAFFKKNPAPGLFESLQQVNGVRPQVNCSICNTGDIHINGLEGPYTMITIDGMPVVSSLASVYGLYGIPVQLIERLEIVKGPASGLYGPEAIGGLINIITRTPDKAPRLSVNAMVSSWLEKTMDAGYRFRAGKNAQSLLGLHLFHYGMRTDNNNDGFTDIALQQRISVFSKARFLRKNQKTASLAARYFYEDRWGGESRWTPLFRGSDLIYAESIYTNRWELMGQYQLPLQEKVNLSLSATGHRQDAWYGKTPYLGKQQTGFLQLTWDKQQGAHAWLAGLAFRGNYYDDNSTATRDTLSGVNRPEQTLVPGIFLQEEWKPDERQVILAGFRWDHHPVHKSVFTPRLAWKISGKNQDQFRLNAGTGFRVVNLFTEEHAALSGARAVEIRETLRPEKSLNINLQYSRQLKWERGSLQADLSAWYTRFNNQILPDYDTDPAKIIYRNLPGYSVSKGISLNSELNSNHTWKLLLGITVQHIRKIDKDSSGKKTKQSQVLTEPWSLTWTLTKTFPASGWSLDYTGNIYGPMRLPLVSLYDPRPAYSPVWSLQNLQATKKFNRSWELFMGVKNLLNWTPARGLPFLISRANDPFDRQVEYNTDGTVKQTAGNPWALRFDPSYIYAPNQGIRFFSGLRYQLR